jgi:glycosyltransferase involved in cell wall biosynthesis
VLRLERRAHDAERVVNSLDVMFHPARREGSSAIVRVALLSRVPVVASNAPALVDAVGPHGVLVEADDVEGAAHAVERVLARDDDTSRRIDRAYAFAMARYPIERMIEGTWAVYDAVLRQGA